MRRTKGSKLVRPNQIDSEEAPNENVQGKFW